MIFETAIIVVSYLVTVLIRFNLMNGEQNDVNMSASTLGMIFIFAIFTVVLFYFFHLYVPLYKLKPAREIIRVYAVSIVMMFVLGTGLYLMRIEDFSRVILGLFGLVSATAISLKRLVAHLIYNRRYQNGIGIQKVVLIGCGELAQSYVNNINENIHYGLKVIGYIGSDPDADLGEYLGGMHDLEYILESNECDELVIALDQNEVDYFQRIMDVADKQGLRVTMIPFYSKVFPAHPTMETIGDSVLIDLRATPLDNLALSTVKRTADILGSAFLLIVLSPLMFLTALIIKLESPGPVLFRQTRVGLNRKEFTMLKFRSMRQNDQQDTAWSTSTDSRRTKFGSFIRKYSIDELPQLFNVFKGEMSLVGPRPEIPYYTRQFKETVPLYLVRQQVRPGMTGWAQVHGLRGDTSIEARVKFDIWYIENWSLWLDVKILFMTLWGGFVNQEEFSVSSRNK